MKQKDIHLFDGALLAGESNERFGGKITTGMSHVDELGQEWDANAQNQSTRFPASTDSPCNCRHRRERRNCRETMKNSTQMWMWHPILLQFHTNSITHFPFNLLIIVYSLRWSHKNVCNFKIDLVKYTKGILVNRIYKVYTGCGDCWDWCVCRVVYVAISSFTVSLVQEEDKRIGLLSW